MIKQNPLRKDNNLLAPQKISGWLILVIFAFVLGLALGGLLKGLWGSKNDQSLFFQARQGGYQFINPLLDFEPLEETRRGDLVNLRKGLEELINEATRNHKVFQVSVYFKELSSGAWIGIDEKEEFAPASLLKVPLMIVCLKIAEENPDYLNQTIEYRSTDEGLSQNILPGKELIEGKFYSVGTLIRRMIVYSDNQALYTLLEHVEESRVEEVYSALGLRLPDRDGDQENFITVKDYAALFRVLYNASYLNREMSEKALKLLSEVSYDNGLGAGVPKNIAIANKFGERVYSDGLKQFHDCGIIYYPDKPYLLCVMTKGTDLEALQQVIQRVSGAVYQVVGLGD